MRINQVGNPSPPEYRRLDSPAVNQHNDTSSSQAQPSSTKIQLDSLRDLLQSTKQASGIRQAVVDDVRSKLDNGEYNTRQAAIDTASSILES